MVEVEVVLLRGSKGALSCLVEKSTGVNVAEESVVVVADWELDDGLVEEANRASKSMSKLVPLTAKSLPGNSWWIEKSWLRNSEKSSSGSWREDQFS
jgi:hypothetical protein